MEQVLSKEVIILGQYKLIVAQNFGWAPVNDWRQPDGSWIKATNDTTPPCGKRDLGPNSASLLGGVPGSAPCLFDIRADMSEKNDLGSLSSSASTVAKLWEMLNLTVLTSRDCSNGFPGSEGTVDGCSPPELLGAGGNAVCAMPFLLRKRSFAKTGSGSRDLALRELTRKRCFLQATATLSARALTGRLILGKILGPSAACLAADHEHP